MPNLTLNEIRARATGFAKDWADASRENAEAQIFWHEFFQVFGVPKRRVIAYEEPVKKLGKKRGRIDAFWKGRLLVEHKSRGEDLDRAFVQATDYFPGIKDDELPRYVLVSDFARLRLYDLDRDKQHEFRLAELPRKLNLFGFISGYRTQEIREQDPVNLKAVEKMGKLHDLLKKDGYTGHNLEVFLVRLLFCLFADDTGIFTPADSFHDLIELRSHEDGSDLGGLFGKLFQVLNTPQEARQHSLDEQLADFPYVDGKLFEEKLDFPEFTRSMRAMLLECCAINWGAISPAIFGAMFQKIIDLDEKERRRQIGAHYTSEENILKLIKPLFLDGLREEFEKVRNNKNSLFEFHKKISNLHFLDPACGCGNFLVITYRELRKLELDVLRAAEQHGAPIGDVFKALSVDVDQFYGIEIEEFPAQIAQVAMWLIDHQMNVLAGDTFGEWIWRIPLVKSANIRKGNALRIDWADFAPPERLNYILGNPPFGGKAFQTSEQKEDLNFVTKGIKGAGVLDYVAGWYLKAAQYITGSKEAVVSRDKRQFADVEFGLTAPAPNRRAAKQVTGIEDLFVSFERKDAEDRRKIICAFVSTNSITQGEQVGVLWSELLRRGVKIHFAHRTFQWMNEAPGQAAVHCVIVGFAAQDAPRKFIFEYTDIKGAAHETIAENINPYLVDAPDVVLPNRRDAICAVSPWSIPSIVFGSMPNDGGYFVLSARDKKALVSAEPESRHWIRRYLGSYELINGIERWCLWLKGMSPADLKKMPLVLERVEGVRQTRAASTRETTQELAATPTLFGEDRQPRSRFIGIPKTSSERRRYIPIAFLEPECIANTELFTIDGATPFHFGVLTSAMHMAWVGSVCGRLKSDFRYSAGIVYNNFSWPAKLTDQHRDAIESAAQSVLDARAEFPDASLAALYGPTTMPPALTKAHDRLDRAVDAAYVPDGGKRTWANDGERVAFLFRRYQAITSLLPTDADSSRN